MTSDYKQGSPGSTMLNVGAMGTTPGFGLVSQVGSDLEYGTPQSLTIDTVMAGSDLGQSAAMADYHSAPVGLPAYSNGFGQTVLGQPAAPGPDMQQHQHRGSMSSLPDQSPGLSHHHRLSFSSNGQFANQGRTNSIGSDGTSQIGDNPYANNSNDTVNSQAPADETPEKNADGANNAPPPWSELKTKAGKERKRLPLACIACRRKKIRCSGEKPACKHCLRSRIPCVYKVTTRKAAPRTDYMAMLDKRLKRMEERVIKVIPKEDQGVVTATGRAVVKPPLPPPPKSAGATKKRGAESAFGDELDDWANANSAKAELKLAGDRDLEKEPSKAKDQEEQNLLKDGAASLPTPEIQEHLAEVFFDFVYGQSYPLLHKPSFMRRLAQGTIPPVLILAVCAMAARFSNHPGVRTEPAFLRGEHWASAARDIALKRYDTPNITILIVYLILGLHEFGTCQGGRSWMFGGMAQRMAYALQLHRDLDHEPKRDTNEKSELTFTDREIRRRTMWSCFLMDRFNSSGTERPIFVGEHYIRAQLPIRDKYYQMEVTGPTEDLEGNVPNPVEPGTGQMSDAKDNMGVSAWLIRLVSIWGRLINYHNLGGKDRDCHPMWSEESMFHNIKKSIKEWREMLPKTLCYTEENLSNYASEGIANQFIFLHIVYFQIILFTNRFALPTLGGTRPQLPKDMPPEFAAEASRAAREAADQISELVHKGMDYRVVAPFAGYSAFLSSTVHIHGVFQKNASIESKSKQYLAWNVKYLTKMKKYWGMFYFVTENLRELYRRHADAARSGKAGGKDGDHAVFQYGDWFDRYPHGVSGTDYEEPSTEVKKEPGADAVLGQKSDLQSVEEFFSKMSPPSRAPNNTVPQPSQKKASKKRSKHENKQSMASSHPQPQDTKPTDGQQHTSQPITDDILGTHDFQDTLSFTQQSAAFPPGYQGPHNALLATPPQQFMSQLDRQIVLNSYNGVSATSGPNQHAGNPSNMLDANHGLDHFDFNAYAQNTGNGWGSDPSAAWFMPFNMEPPAVGEDNNLFNGSLGWSNFGGFGLPPTGLTPRPEFDVDTGQEGMSGDGMDGTQ